MMNKVCALVAIVAEAVLLCAVAGHFIFRHGRIVEHGAEVRLKCRIRHPVEGHWIRIDVAGTTTNHPFHSDEIALYSKLPGILVRLEPSSNGVWEVSEAAHEASEDGLWVRPVSAQFTTQYANDYDYDGNRKGFSAHVLRAAFPGRLFVGEKSLDLEHEPLGAIRSAAVAVYRVKDGEMALVDIEVDGKPILRGEDAR